LIASSGLAATNEGTKDQNTPDVYPSVSNMSDNFSLNIISKYETYIAEFQNAKILVRIGKEVNSSVWLELEQRNSSGTLLHEISQLVTNTTREFTLHTGDIGTYNITVRAILNGEEQIAHTTYRVISVWDSSTVRFSILALAFFGALLVLIGISKQDTGKEEILRFVFLSGIVGSMLSSLIFTQFPVGDDSPIGLVNPPPEVTELGKWVINIGGLFYIPVYVIIFGLIGGYLRYLYKTSRLLTDEDLRKEREDIKNYLTAQSVSDADRKLIFFESLKDVALFLLAPILAIVVWFLFSEYDPIKDSPSLLAVFSFASGLVTTEIVNSISGFIKNNMSRRTGSSSK
jgi:hypothetical protein